MKTKLLFTVTLLFTSFITFGQAYPLDPEADPAPRARVADTEYTQNFTSGTFAIAGSGAHVNISDAALVNGTISFDVVTASTDFLASITFHVRKLYGNSGSIDFTVNGTTDSYTLPSDASATDVDAFEIYNNLTFSQDVIISSVPTTITLDVNNIAEDAATNGVKFRYYSVTFNNIQLGGDDFDLNQANFSIYPNPVTNNFQIDAIKSIESVEIYSVTGQLLKTFSEETTYDISDLAAGMYIADIKTEVGSKTLRVIKN